jgi:hypothetical protein
MADLDLTIWNARWESLAASMATLSKQIEVSSVARKDTLRNLLTCLQAFAQDQYEFFRDGFVNGDFVPGSKLRYLETSVIYPPEYVLRTTLDQIAFDLGVIQRAFNQRMPGPDSQQASETLATADKLARQALERAKVGGLLNDTTAITYFQKQAAIRVIPYASVALIGVPFTAIYANANSANVRDLLAIPHEVGHYVFWHGKQKGDRLKGKMYREMPPESLRYDHWLEEIFADTYGCLVAGPVIGLDFQELQMDELPDRFTSDDGEHPVPALRPYIYADILKSMQLETAGKTQQVKAAGETLAGIWESQLKKRNGSGKFKLKRHSSDREEEVDLSTARTAINELTKMMLAHLGSGSRDGQATPSPWTTDLGDSATASQTPGYHGFEDHVNDTRANPSIQLEVQSQELCKSDEWMVQLKTLGREATSKMPPELWLPVFSMSGWVIGGPEGEQVPKG